MSAERAVSVGTHAYGELLAAAEAMLDALKELPVRQRPIARFYRLQDAIDHVREAHQMEGFEFTLAAGDRS